jgi:hypothetical protein
MGDIGGGHGGEPRASYEKVGTGFLLKTMRQQEGIPARKSNAIARCNCGFAATVFLFCIDCDAAMHH